MKLWSENFLEKIPGLLSWTVILFPLAFSFILPELVAVFYIIFSLFWLMRAASFSFYLTTSYLTYKKQEKKDWKKIYHKLSKKKMVEYKGSTAEKIISFHHTVKEKNENIPLSLADVIHIVVIATYKEPFEILDDTLQAIQNSNYPNNSIYIVLATEERDKKNASVIATKLEKKYGKLFGEFFVSSHPMDLPDELPGKGGNITYATKEFIAHLRSKKKLNTKKDQESYVLTTLDADSKVHKDYFNVLSFNYVKTPNRKHFSYQPLPFLYNNLWEVPIFNRVVAISSTFWHLIESGRRGRLRNFSSHAQPLTALIEMDYWSKMSIVEDGHQFWRSYMHFNGKYGVIPLFIPIYQDAVSHDTYMKTLLAQYKQLRRWAYGASDVAFILQNWFKKRKFLPHSRTFFFFMQFVEGHLMWATAPLILTFSSATPKFINPHFAESVVYYNLSQILAILFTISLVGILISIWISFLMVPKVPKKMYAQKKLYLQLSIVFQWFLLPITTVLFAAIPAIDTQTRLLFGKKLTFNVTKKVRK